MDKRKKKFGTFYQLSPGNVEQNIERFNKSTSGDIGSIQSQGEATSMSEDLQLREDGNQLTPQERQELKNLITTANDFDVIASYLNTKIAKKNESLQLEEDLFDDLPAVEIEPISQEEIELSGPQTEAEFGDASIISDAIQNCWAMIDQYNSMQVSCQNENIKELAKDLTDIEMQNIAKLEEILKEVSPNAEHLDGVTEDEI